MTQDRLTAQEWKSELEMRGHVDGAAATGRRITEQRRVRRVSIAIQKHRSTEAFLKEFGWRIAPSRRAIQPGSPAQSLGERTGLPSGGQDTNAS